MESRTGPDTTYQNTEKHRDKKCFVKNECRDPTECEDHQDEWSTFCDTGCLKPKYRCNRIPESVEDNRYRPKEPLDGLHS